MAKIPNYISEVIPYSRVLKRKNGFRASIGGYIARSKYLIANEFGVDPDKVHDIFLRAWDKSEKDYPSPSVIFPQNSKEADLYNNYVLYIWKYYVEDKSKPKPPPKEPKPSEIKQPKVEEQEEQEDQEVDPDNPYAGDDEPSMVQEMGSTPAQKTGGISIIEKTYEGVREDDLVGEDIDERILRILGLEDAIDIDYGTYQSLLKGEVVKSSVLGNSNLSREEGMLLAEEFKRIKGKVGRFKVNKKKLQTGNVSPLKSAKNFVTGATEPPQKLLPPAPEQKPKRKATLEENIAAIRKSVESILKLMENQFSALRKQLETDRRSREKSTRDTRENKLEAGVKKTVALAKKILAPAMSLLDRIINFITTVLIGRALIKLVDWLANPENRRKLDSLLRFIGDWWPTILGAWVLFATPLGKVIRTVVTGIARLTLFMARKGIPALMRFAKAHPLATAAVVGGAGVFFGAKALADRNEDMREQDNKRDDAGTITPKESAKTGQMPSAGQLYKEQMNTRGFSGFFNGGGQVPPRRRTMPNGGKVNTSTGKRIRGAGKDTQLVAAQPGEVVISKKAVDKFGAPFFLNLNRMGGGTNIPTHSRFSDIQFAQGGGQIGININDGLERKTMPELTRMLDPTIPGARSPEVFRAASEARKIYANADRQERERQVLIATIRAVRNQNSGGGSSSTTLPRSGTSVSNKIIAKPTITPPSPSSNSGGSSGGDMGEGGEITAKNIVSGSGISAPLTGVIPGSDNKTSSAAVKPSPATVARGSMRPLQAPPPPEPSVNVMKLSASQEQKMLGTGSQPSGTRGHDIAFDAFIQTSSRMDMMAIYGITGVA